MRVLVTGGAGFIGSHIVDTLVAGGHDVVVLDRVAVERDDVTAITGELNDPDVCLAAATGAGAVCHQAARVGLGVDFGDVGGYVADNDAGTASLLHALHRVRFRGRLVLASSMVVYGEGRYRCPDHGRVRPLPRASVDLGAGLFEPRCPACRTGLDWEPVSEDDPIDPRNVYAATKAHQEHLCAAFGREHDVPVTALRYHNVYGRRMPRGTPYAGVAAVFCDALGQGIAPRVFEDGAQARDFVHVGDVARANLLALTTDAPFDGALNVASGQARTVLDMAVALADAFGPAAPRPTVVGGYRLGDVRHVVASPERAAQVIGFRARIGFSDGMRELAAALTVPAAPL
ncbi:MAG: NAD-dependent epimerase/dehydratase family protein [Acidimicrobiia bacterium]